MIAALENEEAAHAAIASLFELKRRNHKNQTAAAGKIV